MKKSNDTGQTVREIVERHPELISEVWCRKVFRQLLQLLERQYAMQSPHRVITPDTVFIHDNGSLLLLPSLISDPMPEIADDLTALARIVHYAITQEVVPTGPLRGRAPEGFSESLINAIDRGMAFDPARRPRTINELRDLLGIVPFKPAPSARQQARAAQAGPAVHTPQSPRPQGAVPQRPVYRRPWAWVGGAILLGAGLGMLATQGPKPTFEHLAQTLPAGREGPRARPATPPAAPAPQAAAVAAPAGTPAPGPQPNPSLAAQAAAAPVQAVPAPTKASPPQEQAGKPPGQAPAEALAAAPARKPVRAAVRETVPATPARPAPAAEAAPKAAAPKPAADEGAVFTLRIQPWGRVYVDGIERGISPPVKRLALAPGRHVVLVANPGSRDRVLEVDTAGGDGSIAVDFDGGR